MLNTILWVLLSASIGSCDPLIPPSEEGRLYNTDELIELRGYRSEKHDIVTGDGYNLTLFRVLPSATASPVVLIQHSLLGSSDSFVTDRDALAFAMSKHGYDVWLGNARGNYYSRKHVTLNPDEPKFWNYSLHEIAVKDTKTSIDYILNTTSQDSLYYVGHCMGTTVYFILTSVLPEYNRKVKAMAAMAPIAYFVTYSSYAGNGTATARTVKQYMKRMAEQGKVEAFPRIDVDSSPSQLQCSDVLPQFQHFCYALVSELNETVGREYFPAGISMKILEHYRQATVYGELRYFDSASANKNSTPPAYNLSLVTTPVSLYYCDQDKFVSHKEIDILTKVLPNVVDVYKVPSDVFDHGDFLFPMDADNKYRIELYQKIIEAFKKLL